MNRCQMCDHEVRHIVRIGEMWHHACEQCGNPPCILLRPLDEDPMAEMVAAQQKLVDYLGIS